VDLVLAFVNTHADGGGRVEQFSNAQDFGEWLRTTGLGDEDRMVVTGVDALSARELRDALITIMLAHSSDDEVEEDIESATIMLRESVRRYPLVPAIRVDGVNLTSEQGGVSYVLGSVVAAVTESALRGDWQRLKACRNPSCHTGFFDRSRNGSGAFCSAGCRSQASMRAFRQRQKQSRPAASYFDLKK
jgi:predicted RNA-binding Zn ribbon-like protein